MLVVERDFHGTLHQVLELVADEDGDLLGDAVNVSARLEGKADVGGVAVSKKVVDILAADKEKTKSMWQDHDVVYDHKMARTREQRI